MSRFVSDEQHIHFESLDLEIKQMLTSTHHIACNPGYTCMYVCIKKNKKHGN